MQFSLSAHAVVPPNMYALCSPQATFASAADAKVASSGDDPLQCIKKDDTALVSKYQVLDVQNKSRSKCGA
jgi:hypothetical protein